MYDVRNLYTSLLILLTQATDRKLARKVRYVVEENRILQARLPERINVTRNERNRLLRFDRELGSAIRQVVHIDSPTTFLRGSGKSRRRVSERLMVAGARKRRPTFAS
jgi:hypothetical protein